MGKNIKDYRHLYLGCEVWSKNGLPYTLKPRDLERSTFKEDLEKPILRPLSDMTEESSESILDEICEAIGVELHLYYQAYSDILLTINGQMEESSLTVGAKEMAEITRILCKHSFDLFGLIEAGLAIDKTKNIK